MRKLKEDLEKRLESLDKRWRALELRRQQQYILYFFMFYVLVTAAVLFKICLDTVQSDAKMEINHIENPARIKK